MSIGGVPVGDAVYVVRPFESRMLQYLMGRSWVLLLGPRQHGKTSALWRTRSTLRDKGFRCALVDLQGVPDHPLDGVLEWFATLLAKSLDAGDQAQPRELVRPAGRGDSLQGWLEAVIPMPGPPVVVIIDEASSIRSDGVRNSFFGQVRSIMTASAAAGAGDLCKNIYFVFAGTFRPETLVDERNSPFNVCRRVDTDDFTLAEIEELTALVLGTAAPDIASAVYQQVGGQPFLVRELLSIAQANEGDKLAAINTEVENLASGGSDHVQSLFTTVVNDAELKLISSDAVQRGRVRNDPANASYRYMTVVGLMRRDGENLVFRNPLYQRVAGNSLQLNGGNVARAAPGAARVYPQDIANFAFVSDESYREIAWTAYNGAVSAVNGGSNRLALVGFGVSLEAILIDLLLRQPQGVVPGLVAAAAGSRDAFQFGRHETQNDPGTWSLSNLMKAGRRLQKVHGPLEIPNSLREMRNFVHPAVMKQQNLREDQLGPEASGAAALLDMVMRDIQRP